MTLFGTLMGKATTAKFWVMPFAAQLCIRRQRVAVLLVVWCVENFCHFFRFVRVSPLFTLAKVGGDSRSTVPCLGSADHRTSPEAHKRERA